MLISVVYRVAFQSPPGQTRPQAHFDAVDDQAALAHMAATRTRDEVLALFAMPDGRGMGTQRPVWVRL